MHISHLANFLGPGRRLSGVPGKNRDSLAVTAAPTRINVPWLPVLSQHPGQAGQVHRVEKSEKACAKHRAKHRRAGSSRFAQGNRQCNHNSTKSMWCVDTIWSGKSDMILMNHDRSRKFISQLNVTSAVEAKCFQWRNESYDDLAVGRNRENGCEMVAVLLPVPYALVLDKEGPLQPTVRSSCLPGRPVLLLRISMRLHICMYWIKKYNQIHTDMHTIDSAYAPVCKIEIQSDTSRYAPQKMVHICKYVVSKYIQIHADMHRCIGAYLTVWSSCM